jgi:hypothetical protein
MGAFRRRVADGMLPSDHAPQICTGSAKGKIAFRVQAQRGKG